MSFNKKNNNRYAEYLETIRLKNYAGTLCSSSKQICFEKKEEMKELEKLAVGELTVVKINGTSLPCGIVAQGVIRDYKIANDITFSTGNVCDFVQETNLRFNIPSPLSNKQVRFIRITACLIFSDPTPNQCQNAFFTIFHDDTAVYNTSVEYITTNSDKFSNIIRFEHFMNILADTDHQITLYATTTSFTGYISSDLGVYSRCAPVGASYFTIEDMGGFA